jgi:glutamate/tyrosine decarboxylase-like PLP-dependent enzyme
MSSSDTDLSLLLQSTMQHALTYLSPEHATPVGARASLEALRERLGVPLADKGVEAGRIVDELVLAVDGGLHNVAGGRFYGWVMGGSVPAALAADWLTSAWDQNAGMFAVAPAATVVEEVAGGWLKELLGIPAGACFGFVTGCQMSHTTCLAAARHALLARRGWDVEQEGLAGAPKIRILTSSEVHSTVLRSARLLGLGTKNIVSLRADEQGRLMASGLEEELRKGGDAPTIVVLQAGDLNIGAFDDFETLIPIAHRYGAWVHVDGAFGLWAAASPKLRHLMRGAEAAESWSTDGHKWLNVPYDCGYAFVADAAAHRGAMTQKAAYLTHGVEARDPLDWNPEFSRRARGFATYAAIRQLGRDGVANLIERCCEYAHALVTRIGALDGAEMLWEPTLNQGLVRFLDRDGGNHDALTERVIAAIDADGEGFFTGTTWRGMRAMRVSVCNWQTSAEDVDAVVGAVGRVLARV